MVKITWLLVLDIIISLATHYVNSVPADLGIIFCSTSQYDEAVLNKVVDAIKYGIDDTNNDDEQTVECMSILLMDDREYAEQNYTSVVKLTGSFSEETNYVYIYDKAVLDANISDIDRQSTFHLVDKWLTMELNDNDIYSINDKGYAVSLKNSKILKQSGINSDDLYVMIKCDTDSPYKNEKAYKNAVVVANELIK